MNQPALFKYATKELSQDAFFAWLLAWADHKYHQLNQPLNETAQDFISILLEANEDLRIKDVEVVRQWNNIDIKVVVNNEYFIFIEDKTNSGEHSSQLARYREIAEKHYSDHVEKLRFRYLKTGNESTTTLKEVHNNKFIVVDRKAVLEVLNKRPIVNDIFNDFLEYLTEIEIQTNRIDKMENITTNWRTAEGFFMKLQESNSKSDWRYVANQMGGFLGFWYPSTSIADAYHLYIQIENTVKGEIKLVVKITGWEQNTENLHRILDGLKRIAAENGLTIGKPARYRSGKSSTLAVVHNAFQSDDAGNFDFQGFLLTLKQLETTLQQYANAQAMQA